MAGIRIRSAWLISGALAAACAIPGFDIDPSLGTAGGGTAGSTAGDGDTQAGASSGLGGNAGSTSNGGSVGASTGTGGVAGIAEPTGGSGGTGASGAGGSTGTLATDIDTIVVIYLNNRSFDGLFGNFPGAHGLSDVVNTDGTPKATYVAQKDRDGATMLSVLPSTWSGVTAAGNPTTITQAQSTGLPNRPFGIENGFAAPLTTADVTRDLGNRFFENIMEINGGTNDMFAAWVDAGGLTMGHWDYSKSGLYKLAQDYVLADNFFEGAFGGSFLNHQYLICACAPSVSSDWVTSNAPSQNVIGAFNGRGVPQLATNTGTAASALDGPPIFMTGNIVPKDYFGVGDGYRVVNTMQPPYQPSGNSPTAGATGDNLKFASPAAATTLPPQTETTVGDQLTAKDVSWAWYAADWDLATIDGTQASTAVRTVIYTPSGPRGAPDFQAHHHPFNYYSAFDPVTHVTDRAAHLKDYTALLSDIGANSLPQVVYYKPNGNVNQHPGYANLDDGDAHVVDLVNKLKQSSQWAHMVIVITYDENGGQWDHVAPPKGDLLGPGTRIPAIIVSPYAKTGTVDHTQYDTGSILRLIAKRFGLAALPGITSRDAKMAVKMGDLTNALDL